MVSIRNHHMHKTQMHAQIRAHLVERVTALFMLPAFTLCAGVSLALPASVQLKYSCFIFDPRKNEMIPHMVIYLGHN